VGSIINKRENGISRRITMIFRIRSVQGERYTISLVGLLDGEIIQEMMPIECFHINPTYTGNLSWVLMVKDAYTAAMMSVYKNEDNVRDHMGIFNIEVFKDNVWTDLGSWLSGDVLCSEFVRQLKTV